ncbi:MAG: bifunctional demethylmenaquinone methyltransferase/2-methoxy-6-polyprenyl-1,4-benzoquinol methylase UbiE [Anaerolineales bacterium]
MNLSPQERRRYVQGMFTRIAARYDLMNRVMTFGQDISWRREVIRRASLQPGDALLDLGAGTGDLAREALRQQPACTALAADYTLEMMRIGRARYGHPADWSGADALNLPFPDKSFDVVVSGYLLRNVIDLPRALSEQYRVLRPGGRIVALDTTRPPKNLLSPFINFHMHTVIPLVGRILTGEADAYTYLPDSTAAFLTAEDLAARLQEAGFRSVGFHRRMLGTMAIHWGRKERHSVFLV